MHALTSIYLLCLALSVVQSQSHGDLRLKQKDVTDTSFSEGRVEIFLNGQWGTICEDRFDSVDANIACHQLGFAGSIAEPTAGFHSPHGKGSESDGPIWLDEVGCTDPTGLHILSCVNPGIGVQDCDHFSDVAITCSPDPLPQSVLNLRLQGGVYPSQGRLEFSCGSDWWPVCSDGITDDEADWICRRLGYTEASSYEHLSTSNSHSVQLDNVSKCLEGGPVQNCSCPAPGSPGSCSGELSIQCAYSIPYGAVQLTQSASQTEGLVEVFVNGRWRTLCAGSFTESDANAVCGKLGFLRSEAFGTLGLGHSSAELLTKQADCDLHTDSLFACLAREASESCPQADPAAVTCTTDSPPTDKPTTTTEPDSLMLPFSLETLIAICLGGGAILCFCCLFTIVCCTHLFCDSHVSRKRRRPLLDRPRNTFTFTDIDSKLDKAYDLEMKPLTHTVRHPPPLVPCSAPQIPSESHTATVDCKACNSPYPFPQDVERIQLRFSQESLLDESSSDVTLTHNLQQLAEQLEPPEEVPPVLDSYDRSNLGSISEEGSLRSESDTIQRDSCSETEF